jgi:formate hydrogenlyase subunit 6/NADH:ubiquinone oxidoreductase subunit I
MLIIEQENLEKFLGKPKEDFIFFDVRNDKLPFKKYFLPPMQETFTRNPMSSDFKVPKPPQKFVIFGLNLLQLEALTQLDEIMKKPNEDFFYWQNRKQAIVIGLLDEEIDSMPGGDIIFQKISDNQYKIWLANARAQKLIEENKEFFSAIGGSASGRNEVASSQSSVARQSNHPSLTTNIPATQDWSQSMRQLLLDSELLANAVEWSHGHKIWEDLGQKCLGCGICTYVCPLCHCFSIEDRVGLDDKCSRCRKWDACTLPNFSKISGGHSFRPTIKERYYNWFYHKFVRAYREYGKSQCVGCGACKRNCPAEIDIQEILKIILEEYKKEIQK